MYTKKLVFKRKEGKLIYTKEPSGVCGGPLRTVLVYRFLPPRGENLVCPSKSRETNFLARCPGKINGICWECLKSFRTKSLCVPFLGP